MLRWFRPTGAWVYASIAPVLVFVAANVDRNYQTDLWHHLARGREIVSRGEILNHDIFTYTVAGKTFQDPNWLTQVCFYELYHLSGDSLGFLQAVNATLLAITLVIVFRHCWRTSGSMRLAAAFSVLTFLGLWQLILIRPQTLSFLLFALMYLILDAAEGERRLLLVPPLLMALWVNLHGAYPIGLALIAVFTVAKFLENSTSLGRAVLRDPAAWSLALCLLASALATLINPYGWNLYRYVGDTSATAAARRIDEWLPPNVNLLIGKIWIAFLGLTVVALGLSKRRPTLREVALAACFLGLSTMAVRMVAWFLIVAAPILAAHLATAPVDVADKDADQQPTVVDGLIWCALVVSMVLSLPGLERFNPLLRLTNRGYRMEDDLQVVVERIRQDGATGRIFSRFDWGEYLGWSLTPDYTVFMDGRIEIIPDAVWEEYEAINDARHDWQAILDRYGVTHLVLSSRHHQQLLSQVKESGRWEEETIGEVPARLFVRRH